ncbi:MAG: hypothetical protein GYA24_10180 [Candidatus Lokiarchaeota archaeon]|nr:hypothetical protein [Candidatus Lokiarchaeota archaeon]
MNARIVPSEDNTSRIDDPKATAVDICPECNNSGLIEDTHRGELICTACGAVLERGAFDYNDKRAYTAEEVESRKHNGSPISALSDISWTTVLRATDKNASPALKRAARWNSRLSWEKRNLLSAVTEIKRVCSALGVPRLVAETAATYYRKVQKMNVLRGRSISGFVGACVYLSCRTSKIPRSVDDIYKEMAAETTDRDIRICYRVLLGELKIRVPRISAVALLPRYASVLALPQDTTNLAEKMLAAFEARNNTAGKDPKGIVAAALYLACKIRDEETAQKRVATACGVTEVTLRSRIKEFAPIIPKNPTT